MGVVLRPANARGHANHGWLDTFHSFSFANYYDSAHMGFRSLRVINDDTVQPGKGFGQHGHRDMEIISYVVRGCLAHEDSFGGKGLLRRGDVQAMSAGTGLRHSEFNPSHQEDVRFLQIWIEPSRSGLPFSCRQTSFPDAVRRNVLAPIAAPVAIQGALLLHQDVTVMASLCEAGVQLDYPLASGRGAWLQLVEGAVEANGVTLRGGDGLALECVERIFFNALQPSEFLLFDLA